MRLTRRACLHVLHGSAFAGFRFPPEVIVLAVRWYLRFGVSYRDLEELLAERGVNVDHVTVYRGSSSSHCCWPRPPDHAAIGLGSLVGRRGLCEDRCTLAVCLPSGRPVRPGHRCVRVTVPGCPSGPPFFDRAIGAPRRGRWQRSSPTGPRPTRSCWRRCSRRRGTEPTRTPTTGSRPTCRRRVKTDPFSARGF